MGDRVFTPDEEKVLQDIGIRFTVQPGHLIYLKGDMADKVYYIIKGQSADFLKIYIQVAR